MKLEPLHPIQIQRFREMAFAEKWALAHGFWLMGFGSWVLAHGFWLMGRDARLSATRRANPDLNEEECQKLVAREFARART